MKTVYFVQSLHEAGTSVQALTTCVALRKEGYDITLVVAENNAAFTREPTDDVVIHYLSRKEHTHFIQTVWALTSYIWRARPSLMISGAKRVNLIAILAHIFSKFKPRLVLTLTNNWAQKKFYNDKGRRVSSFIQTHLYRLADCVIVLSHGMRDEMMGRGFPENKLVYCPPAINVESIAHRSYEAVDHPWLAQEKPDRKTDVILAVGRLVPQKNYPLLLRTFAKVAQKRVTQKGGAGKRPLRLIILGTGKKRYTAYLKTLCQSLCIEDCVSFVGFEPNPYKYMRACDVFALSSLWEGFGIVTVEALACGANIVSTDCPHGPREILGENQFGYLAPMYNEDGFEATLVKALDAPRPLRHLQARAVEFGLESSVGIYIELLNKYATKTARANVKPLLNP